MVGKDEGGCVEEGEPAGGEEGEGARGITGVADVTHDDDQGSGQDSLAREFTIHCATGS